LIFSGTPDFTFRAFDTDTGKEVWEKKLPVNPMGPAATFEIDGRQFIVIAASAPRKTREASEDAVSSGAAAAPQAGADKNEEQAAYVAFALPSRSKTTTGSERQR